MKKISLILLCAGSSTRCNISCNKTLYKINDIEVFRHSLNKFDGLVDEVIIVINENDLAYFQNLGLKATLVLGGSSRSKSVKNGLAKCTGDIVLIHDAARPLVEKSDIIKLIKSLETYKLATLYKESVDTTRYGSFTIDREKVKLISTPQAFQKELIPEIIASTNDTTDEISLFDDQYEIGFIKETTNNLKITTKEDLDYVTYKLSNSFNRVGHSLDYHPYGANYPLFLGGLTFHDYHTLVGHSDGDVIYHAVAESIMGACGMGDLGTLFPDTDETTAGIKSEYILSEVVKRVHGKITNIDVTAYLLKPNLSLYKKEMEKNISSLTHCPNVNVKAATLNKRGLISLEEGVGAEAICLVKIDK